MRGVRLVAFLLGPVMLAQEPARPWLPPLFADPAKLSPDTFTDDEYPSIARDEGGRVWVAWSACRPQGKALPGSLDWPDEGQDSIALRVLDGRGWQAERVLSASAGVNYKPLVVSNGDVLWTSRRNGVWNAYFWLGKEEKIAS